MNPTTFPRVFYKVKYMFNCNRMIGNTAATFPKALNNLEGF